MPWKMRHLALLIPYWIRPQLSIPAIWTQRIGDAVAILKPRCRRLLHHTRLIGERRLALGRPGQIVN
jgi:hypothetical protein